MFCEYWLGVIPIDGATPDQLFKAADMALYHAKRLGRDQIKHFIPRLRQNALRKAELHAAIETGLGKEQFRLLYQPVVGTSPHAPTSIEGLLRWQHPMDGLVTPQAFLSDLEDPALLAMIGIFVVEQAFHDMKMLMTNNIPIERIAINVANADFRTGAFVDRFFELSRQSGIEPSCFCSEVTEGVFLGRDFRHVEKLLAQLHEANVEIALDDFGTGYASLTHLRRMAIDRIKSDRSFVTNLVDSVEDEAIVRGIIDIAHSTGKAVTAEGVETLAQAQRLCELGCDNLQGWFFAPASSLTRLPSVLGEMPKVHVLPSPPVRLRNAS